jgi:hypothetical protein
VGPHIKIEGARDGEVVKLPQDLDKLVIRTAKGYILIDLAEQVENMVLMRAGSDVVPTSGVRLIFSPMESARMAVGVIQPL